MDLMGQPPGRKEVSSMLASDKAVKAKVHIIYPGGTIGMAPEDSARPGSPLVPQPLEELKRYISGLEALDIDLSYETFDPPLDSSNLGPAHWVDMARRIERAY